MATTVKAVRVGLMGFGTVGGAVARVLAASKFPQVRLTHIYNRDVGRKRVLEAAKAVSGDVVWTESAEEVLGADVDVIVELVGGLDPAEGWIRTALTSGKSVVTANKQLIAYKGAALGRLAAEHGVQLIHGAAVAGGVPVIPGLLQGQSGDQIVRVSGIVNGTCNFILTKMEAGADYAEVLAEAQRLGYAEANPSADVDGFDARAKLCILSRIALLAELDPDTVPTQTISGVGAGGFSLREGARADDSAGGYGTVGWRWGAVGWGSGAGAGGADACAARFADGVVAWDAEYGGVDGAIWGGCGVLRAWGGGGADGGGGGVGYPGDRGGACFGAVADAGDGGEWRFAGSAVSAVCGAGSVGIVSAIAGALAEVGVNIDSILQRPGHDKAALAFVVTTEACLTSTIARAVEAMGRMDFMLEAPLCLQMVAAEG